MRVFISWSGPKGKAIAEHLSDWLPHVLQSVEPYFTPSDVEKGARWLSDISNELSEAKIGILCVTRESVNSPWLLFEAGALSKELDDTYVCPVVFELKPTDLAGPMAQFQATEFEKDDFRRLIAVFNDRLGDHKLPEKNINAVFEKFWPDIKQNIDRELVANVSDDSPIRTTEEMLDEILRLVRRPKTTVAVVAERVVDDLLTSYIALHNEQAAKSGGYQSTLDSLRRMQKPLEYIIRRHARQMMKTELVRTFSNLTYQVEEKEETNVLPVVDDFDDDIPF